MTRSILLIGEAMVEFARSAAENNWSRGFAGDVFNTAYYLANLNNSSKPVQFFSRIGTDKTSQSFLRFAAKAGIGTDFTSQATDRQMGLYTIDLEGSERHFSYWRSTSAARQMLSDPDVLDRALAASDQVYLSGITLAILSPQDRATLLNRLGKGGQTVMFDPNIRPQLWEADSVAQAAIKSAGQVSDWAFPTFDDDARLFGDPDPMATAHRYLGYGAAEVVVKCGGEACLVATPNGVQKVAAQQVVPVDTTAAGDSFNAAYIAARNSGATPADAAAFAHQVASVVIQEYGALVELPADLRKK